MKRNAGIIGPLSTVAKAAPEKAKMFDLHDQHIQSAAWPEVKEIISVTKGTSTWSQNTSYAVSVTGKGWDAGSEILYWNINPGGCPSAFFNGFQGSFTMGSNNTGSITIVTRFSGDLEWTDITRDFTIQIRSGSNSGPILFETGTQTILGFSMTNAGFSVTSTGEGISRNIYTRYSGVGSQSTYTHRWYYRYLGYTGKSNAELLQGIGVSGTTTQYEGRTTNKTAGTTGYLEFTVRGFASATIVFSMSVDGDTNCEARIKKNGTTQVSITGSASQGGTIGGCTNGDVIRFEYEKPSGAGSVGTDRGNLNYMYVSGVSTASGVANDTTGDLSGLLTEGSNYTHSMGTSLYNDAFTVVKDYVTEGSETAYVQACSYGYGEVGSKFHQVYEDSLPITDTYVTPVVSISESTTSITENDGVGVTFTVTDTAHSVADTYYYSVQGTGITAADFSDNTLTGSITMSPGGGGIQGTVNKQAIAENVSEGESFTFSARTGSSSGTVRATSSSISITDATASTLPIYLDFYESRYGASIGTINIYVVNASTGALASSSLYSATGSYSSAWYNRTTSTFNANIGSSYRWAILHYAGTSYTGDYAVDYLRYYKNGGLQWTENWTSTSGDVGQWVYGATNSSSSTTAFSSISNVVYTSGTGVGKWNIWTGSSPSSSTGPTSAYSGSYYAYTETSTYFSNYHWMFSPSFTV